MRILFFLLCFALPFQGFTQSLSIGIPEPFPNSGENSKGYEFHPKGYRDTLRVPLEELRYLDTNRFHIGFSEASFERIARLEKGNAPRPIVLILNEKPVLGAWLLSPLSSSNVGWVTCILLPSKNALVVQLGHPPSQYKYWEQEHPDPRKEAGLIEFFVEHEKIKGKEGDF